jgi:hypothetical protein
MRHIELWHHMRVTIIISPLKKNQQRCMVTDAGVSDLTLVQERGLDKCY